MLNNIKVMLKRTLSIIILLFSFGFSNAFSVNNTTSENENLKLILDKANKQNLFDDETWLRLLHFRVSPNIAKRSDILSSHFFLSNENNSPEKNIKQTPIKLITENITPKQELFATLKAFYQPAPKNQNIHPQCRFPARFLWLNKRLNLDQKRVPEIHCSKLNEWAKFETLDSLSLIMVSGYFGNPASTFGHLLLKLNNSEFKSSSGNLLDQSINYGAKVPDNESIPVYITKGILGGYTSRFSDKEFYSQDLVYSKQEFRDMWEYELNLDPYQNRLLVFHVWEMLGMEANYYFLKENCGYRIAELLELVTNKKLTPDRQAWYLPISVFQELESIKNSKYIKKITFLPSSQRKLYHSFEQLNNVEKETINHLLHQNSTTNTLPFNTLALDEKARISELMIEYYQYKLSTINDIDKKHKEYTNLRRHWVLERFKLPSRSDKKEIAKIIPIISPAKSEAPLLFQVGVAYNKKRGTLLEVSLTGIHYDLLSNSFGSLKNLELKAFDAVLNFDSDHNINITKVDILNVFKLGLNNTKLYKEKSNHSWRIKAGFKQNGLSCEHCTNTYIHGGLGLTYRFPSYTKELIAYAMIDAEYHADNSGIDIRPNIGIIIPQTKKYKSVLEIGPNKNTGSGKEDVRVKLESRYSFSKNNSLRLSYEKDRGEQIKVAFYHNW